MMFYQHLASLGGSEVIQGSTAMAGKGTRCMAPGSPHPPGPIPRAVQWGDGQRHPSYGTDSLEQQ